MEFHRKASTKDISGWHGPATVTDVTSLKDGQIGIRWQGRLMLCRLQDVRRALTYVCFLLTPSVSSPTTTLQQAAESHVGMIVRLGWFRSKDRWVAFEANKRYPRELLAGLHMASCLLHLSGVVSFRFGSGVHTLPAVACDDTLLVWWTAGAIESWYHAFIPGHQPVNFERLSPCPVGKIACLQFFCESAETVASVRQVVPEIPHLGGPYDPHMPPPRDVTSRVTLSGSSPVLALEDRPPSEPEWFDVATPTGSMSEGASTSERQEDTVEPIEEMFSHFAVRPPVVLVDNAPEAAFVFLHQELDQEPPSLEIAPPLAAFLWSLL